MNTPGSGTLHANAASLVLTPAELAIVRELLLRHVPHREVWAFGSRVKGTTKPFADLDLAILGDTALPPGTLASLAEDFTESDLPFKVDLLDWATTDAAFRERIKARYVPVLPRP